MRWLLNRLNEYSTWLGIFTGLGLLGMKLEPELRELIINAILGVAAIVAFVFRESKRERSTDQLPQTPLPPIDLIGKPERYAPARTEPAESTYQPPMPGADPDPLHHRRADDDWMRDPVPSQDGFKTPVQPERGAVGWNDDS